MCYCTRLSPLYTQLHAVKSLLGELRGGLQRVKSEMMAAMLEEGSGAHEVFSRKMVPFHAAAEREFMSVEVCGGCTWSAGYTSLHVLSPLWQEFESNVYSELKSLAEYFGEEYSSNDPTRILRTVRDFMRLYHRAIGDIEVWVVSTRICSRIISTCIICGPTQARELEEDARRRNQERKDAMKGMQHGITQLETTSNSLTTPAAAAIKHKTPTKTPPSHVPPRQSPLPPPGVDTQSVLAVTPSVDMEVSPMEHQTVDASDEEWSASPVRGAADCPAPLANAASILDVSRAPHMACVSETETHADSNVQCVSPESSPIRQLRLASCSPTGEQQVDDVAPNNSNTLTNICSSLAPHHAEPESHDNNNDGEAVEVSWLQRLSCTADDLGFMAAFRQLQTSGALWGCSNEGMGPPTTQRHQQ